MSETKNLLHGLQQYLAALELLYQRSAEFFPILEQRWGALNAVYDGDAADQFRDGWQRTTRNFHDYEDGLQKIARTLSERVRHLEEYERPVA